MTVWFWRFLGENETWNTKHSFWPSVRHSSSCVSSLSQDTLEYKKKQRPLKIRMLDGTVKTVMVDDSKIVSDMLMTICARIGQRGPPLVFGPSAPHKHNKIYRYWLIADTFVFSMYRSNFQLCFYSLVNLKWFTFFQASQTMMSTHW